MFLNINWSTFGGGLNKIWCKFCKPKIQTGAVLKFWNLNKIVKAGKGSFYTEASFFYYLRYSDLKLVLGEMNFQMI